ncbi:MAG: sensor histidine kinase [Candidatus Nitrosopumilus sp. bin_68KS]
MHRENVRDDDIDPMDAPRRTVFFKKAKPEHADQNNFSLESKILQKTKKTTFSNKPQHLLDLQIDDDLDETNDQLIALKSEIDDALKAHAQTKQKLKAKSASLKKARTTLTETQKKLNSVMLQELQSNQNKKLEVIGELSSKMAHDMKNPLTVLKSQIDLMKLKHQAKEDQVLNSSITNMENAINHITNQINDVLGFIRKPEIRLSFCDLKLLVKNSINEVQLPKEVLLKTTLTASLIKCDVTKVRGIVTNILQNSVEAIGLKGEINITINDNAKYGEIEISDSGPGIPEKILEQIFEPMFTTKSQGTGLGLASSRQILQLHGGQISVKNNPTTFKITLPKNYSISALNDDQ